MPDLAFSIESAEAVPFAAAPLMAFKLQLVNAVAAETIQSVMLRCQIQIEATRRHYTPEEQARLLDLFGEPERWGATLRPTLWTHANLIVPLFTDRCIVDLQVPCSFDFNLAATKYCYGLDDGEIPLTFLFSGTAFYATPGDGLQVWPIPWEKEARFRLPVHAWRALMDHYYPNGAWLRLRRDAFDRLHDYKQRAGVATWEEAIERLLRLEPARATSETTNASEAKERLVRT
jgi:hypothetical protein